MKSAYGIFLALILCSFAFASVEWSFSSPTPLNPSIALITDNAVVATTEGTVYALSTIDGELSWSYDAGEPISASPCSPDSSSIAIATASGKVILLSSKGKETSSAKISGKPLYIACAANRVFVASEKAVSAFTSQGKAMWNYSISSIPGAISAQGKTVYFTSGAKIHSIDSISGSQNWVSEAGDSFLSAPAEYGDSVYFGANDGRFYSFNRVSGKMRWSFQTNGWVISTPAYSDYTLYFGSADGNLYAVSDSGQLMFKFKAGEGVWSSPLIYGSGNGNTLVFGSTNGKAFGIDSGEGKEIWSFSTTGRINSPVESSGSFIFTTSKGKMYSISASPICSFISPLENDVVGDWKIEVKGKAYSDGAVSRVEARTAGGNWVLSTGTDQWAAELDLTGLPEGSLKVECRATDSSGKTESGDYSSLSLIKMQDAPLLKMAVSSPQRVGKNETFTIFAKNKNGENLQGLSVKVGEDKTIANSPFNLTLGKSGPSEISIEKAGFEKVSFIVVGESGDNPILPFFALIAVVAIGFFAYKVLTKKSKAF